MFTENSTKNLPLFGFTILVFLVTILGCGGSGKTCVGTLTVDGKTYEGRDRVEAQARKTRAVCTVSRATVDMTGCIRLLSKLPRLRK